MAKDFYFAWVEQGTAFNEAEHNRMDEDIVSCQRIEAEDVAPEFRMIIRNPSTGLLSPTRKRWAWFSVKRDNDIIKPLIYCWLTAIPENLQADIVELTFWATPIDFEEQKENLAATLRGELKFFDPVFIDLKDREKPNTVLAARTARWHVDPVTHGVSISDINIGEAGNIIVASNLQVPYDSVDITYGEVPLNIVNVKAEVHWDQKATGVINMTEFIAEDPKTGQIKTWTGDGTWTTWPRKGDDIGGDWRFGQSEPVFVKEISEDFPLQYYTAPAPDEDDDPENDEIEEGPDTDYKIIAYVKTPPKIARFYEWTIRGNLRIIYETSRQRTEIIRFRLTADTQDVMAKPGSLNRMEITTSAGDLAEKVDPNPDPEGELLMPIRDLRNKQYFITERGRQSIEYLLMIARKHIAERARMVQIQFAVDLETALDITLKHTATLFDDRLPGGQAIGKVIGLTLNIEPGSGAFGEVIIACSIGLGNTVTASGGQPTYAEIDVLGPDVQVFTGLTHNLDGIIEYPDISGIELLNDDREDDGINFYDMTPRHVTILWEIINNAEEQHEILKNGGEPHLDVAAAIAKLNEFHTKYHLNLKPLNKGPFRKLYNLGVLNTMVLKTFDTAGV